MTMKIYGVPLSVHTRKVILVARLKHIPHEILPVVPVVPGNPPPNWREISPTGLIPAIDDGGFVLADSTAIIHYLERKIPSPAILPKPDRDYATALFLDAWAGSALFQRIIHPLFHNEIVNPKIRNLPTSQEAVDLALASAAPEAFGYLESRNPGRFLIGNALSIADIAIVSNLILFSYLGRRIDDKRYPLLAAYFEGHLRSPAVAGLLKDEVPYARNMGLDLSFFA
jgi:glutathione S-transferase